ncbi:hypothetical protein V8G54_001317 [Vigna mungo]|uniref:Integrase catalytic domain-containing protein n=1 Tax=Vigna mungo TaxID=3915 RepID=A0AAQ3SAW3_VIGMU
MALINPNKDNLSKPQIGSVISNSPDPGTTILTFDSANATGITTWILDSGATDHVVSSLTYFHSYASIKPITINLPNGITTTATHKGNMKIFYTLCLNDVLYIPDFSYNLISISKLVLHNHVYVTFTNSQCFIQDSTTHQKIGLADFRAGLYVLHGPATAANPCVHASSSHNSILAVNHNIWHNRLGHLSDQRLKVLKQTYPFIKYRLDNCNACHIAKRKKLPFPSHHFVSSNAFDLIHIDIWGPCSTAFIHSHRYFLTIVDDHTRYTWVHLMHAKSETRTHIQNFISYVKTQFQTNINIIWSDNEPEFSMHDYFSSQGIIHQTSCNETPQQNGIVERKLSWQASSGRGTWTNRTYIGMRGIWRLYSNLGWVTFWEVFPESVRVMTKHTGKPRFDVWGQSTVPSLASPSTVWFEDEPERKLVGMAGSAAPGRLRVEGAHGRIEHTPE